MYIYICDHGCACDNLLQNVLSVYCTAQAQTNESCITLVFATYGAIINLGQNNFQVCGYLITNHRSISGEPGFQGIWQDKTQCQESEHCGA